MTVQRLLVVVSSLCWVGHVCAQIHLIAPKNVPFGDGSGWIMGATATFGAPFYGDRVLGRLAYMPSKRGLMYCTAEDYDLPEGVLSSTHKVAMEAVKSKQLLTIAVVQRGGDCTITTKVRVAQDKGAHAVIVVDKDDSKLTPRDMRNVVLNDDGYGGLVHIPSVFIAKHDGDSLIAATQLATIVVELNWILPKNHIVKFDWWLSSASAPSYRLLKDFAPKRRTLNEVLNFKPHFAVFGVEGSRQRTMMSNMCLDSSSELCAEDPDGAGPITGADVLLENVRQLCIHELYKVPQHSFRASHGIAAVHFAEKFWAYVERFGERCPLEGRSDESRFGRACSMKLMQDVGIDQAKIELCEGENATSFLRRERDNQAWSPRALRINGWRYSGMLEADLITRAICSAFVEQPSECSELVKPRDPAKPYIVTQVEGFTFKQVILVLLGCGGIMGVAMMVYQRQLRQNMQSALREEVMLEVQAQLGEYKMLGVM